MLGLVGVQLDVGMLVNHRVLCESDHLLIYFNSTLVHFALSDQESRNRGPPPLFALALLSFQSSHINLEEGMAVQVLQVLGYLQGIESMLTDFLVFVQPGDLARDDIAEDGNRISLQHHLDILTIEVIVQDIVFIALILLRAALNIIHLLLEGQLLNDLVVSNQSVVLIFDHLRVSLSEVLAV